MKLLGVTCRGRRTLSPFLLPSWPQPWVELSSFFFSFFLQFELSKSNEGGITPFFFYPSLTQSCRHHPVLGLEGLVPVRAKPRLVQNWQRQRTGAWGTQDWSWHQGTTPPPAVSLNVTTAISFPKFLQCHPGFPTAHLSIPAPFHTKHRPSYCRRGSSA